MTGHKWDPLQVSLDMRHAMNEAGERLFKREEWLTAQQIKGIFPRLAKTQRKLKVVSGLADTCTTRTTLRKLNCAKN